MKKITTLYLVVGLMMACTEKESVDVKDLPFKQDVPSVMYKGDMYRADDPEVSSIISSGSTLQFDFEPFVRLFDSQTELEEFARTAHNGKYFRSITGSLKVDADLAGEADETLVRKSRSTSKDDSGAAKTQNTIYDFQLITLDGSCTAYPVHPYYINLPAYPSGSMDIFNETGYVANAFSFEVPSGGSISFTYRKFPQVGCLRTYIATTDGCHNVSYLGAGACAPIANKLSWSVDVGS